MRFSTILIAGIVSALLLASTTAYAQPACQNCQAPIPGVAAPESPQAAAGAVAQWRGPLARIWAAQPVTPPQVPYWGLPGQPVRNTWRALFGPYVGVGNDAK